MIETGLHKIPAAQYHADPCPVPSLSNSIAKILIDQSPLHAWHAHSRLNPSHAAEESSRFDIGSAAHMLLLERRSDGIVIVEANDWRKKEAKEARDAARANGQYPILAHHYARTNEMVAAAYAFIATTELNGIFELGLAERTLIWREGDAWCRCRPDLLSTDRRIVLDYKTTENAEPEAFIRQIGRMSYDLQAEFYIRGVRTVAEDYESTFVFLAQEVSPPYACSLVSLANAYRAIGQQKVERALELWKHCTATNKWPSYSTRIAYAEPSPWQLPEIDEPTAVTEEEE
jgi:hypothetical protein